MEYLTCSVSERTHLHLERYVPDMNCRPNGTKTFNNTVDTKCESWILVCSPL